MVSHKKLIVFVQGFGSQDLFTNVPPTNLWGWRRNVGLLIHLLNQRGIQWKERFTSDLSEVKDKADLFILRDWRYRPEDVYQFCQDHDGTPVISMLFQCPNAFLQSQRCGDDHAVRGFQTHQPFLPKSNTEDGLFTTDRVIVRSHLNAELFTSLGYPPSKMVLLPHAPIWDIHHNKIVPLNIPPLEKGTKNSQFFNVLFIGESLWRKGLIHLYQAFQALPMQPKRLHVYSNQLLRYVRGFCDLPNGYEKIYQQLLMNEDVIIHDSYWSIAGLFEAYLRAPILVCPTLLDCGPNTLMEAYQIGARVIQSDLSGIMGELPDSWSEIVRAPRYWERFESLGAFAERLMARMIKADVMETALNPPPVEKINQILEVIISTWENLFQSYSIM